MIALEPLSHAPIFRLALWVLCIVVGAKCHLAAVREYRRAEGMTELLRMIRAPWFDFYRVAAWLCLWIIVGTTMTLQSAIAADWLMQSHASFPAYCWCGVMICLWVFLNYRSAEAKGLHPFQRLQSVP